jgi:hypothetical protein
MLRQADAEPATGGSIPEVARKFGISEASLLQPSMAVASCRVPLRGLLPSTSCRFEPDLRYY